MKDSISIEEIKERLRIPDVWRLLGLNGEPLKCCKSPFRDDGRPSFSVYADGRRWKDHGENTQGDVLDFIGRALSCNAGEAIQWARERLGGAVAVPATRACGNTGPPGRSAAKWPELRGGRTEDIEALNRARGIGADALRLAKQRGFLHFGERHGLRFWAVTDRRRQLVELRRMDGLPWPAYKDLPERKAHCIGSGKSWPLGIEEAQPSAFVAMVEGAPDFLAFHDFVLVEGKEERVCCVAMLGGANRIAPEAAAKLRGKEVWLYPHADDAGQRAAEEWAGALLRAGATVRAFDLSGIVKRDGMAGKDLCDVIYLSPECRKIDPKWAEVLP